MARTSRPLPAKLTTLGQLLCSDSEGEAGPSARPLARKRAAAVPEIESDSEEDEPLARRVAKKAKPGPVAAPPAAGKRPVSPPDRGGLFGPLPPMPGDSEDDDSEDDDHPEADEAEQALEAWEAKRAAAAAPTYTGSEWNVEREGDDLAGQQWVDRAHAFRARAQRIYDNEKARLLTGLDGRVTEQHRASLAPFTLIFDKGTRRRGVCKYKYKTIGLSARLIDGGFPADQVAKVIRHELSHACNPKQHHNHVWSLFDISIGGDGRRCCVSEEAKAIIGHKVEIYCPVGGAKASTGHYFAKKQVAPSRKWLGRKICPLCKRNGTVSYFQFRRV